jgi:coenzyme PQQ precursor peptide PqqA
MGTLRLACLCCRQLRFPRCGPVKPRGADTCGFVLFGSIIFPKVQREEIMAWTTPVLVEICIGLEINGYMPADGYVPPEF